MQKEKYNVSSRAIRLPHLQGLHNYQLELINYMLYEKSTTLQKDLILDEIKKVEKYLKDNFAFYVK